MSKFDAGMWLGIIGGIALFFLWVYGLTTPDAPRAIRTVSWVITCMLFTALISFVVYCVLILVGFG